MTFLPLITAVISTNYFFSYFPLVKGQPEDPLPVLLIHGYRSTIRCWLSAKLCWHSSLV